LENPDRHRVDTRPPRPSADEVSPVGRQNRSPEVYPTIQGELCYFEVLNYTLGHIHNTYIFFKVI